MPPRAIDDKRAPSFLRRREFFLETVIRIFRSAPQVLIFLRQPLSDDVGTTFMAGFTCQGFRCDPVLIGSIGMSAMLKQDKYDVRMSIRTSKVEGGRSRVPDDGC
jgi:hypothetical protein